MAVSLSSNLSFLYASFPATKTPSKSPHPTKTLNLQCHFFTKPHQLLSVSISPSFSLSSPLLAHNRSSRHGFTCFLSSQEDDSPIMNEDKEEGEEEQETVERGHEKMWESVDTLIKYYKEALIAGDYQTITKIETAFYRLETEKNELVEKISTMSGEISSGKERYIRLQADFDNFRKRSEKERLSIRSDAQGEVIESMLPMVDNFERAKQQIKPETDREKQIDTSYQGIYKQFVEIMRSLRVAAVATVGKPFDPSLHEAIAREESEEFKEGIVIQEFRRGFRLGDRLLRPAMVKVSSGPGKKQDTAATGKSTDQSAVSPPSEEQPASAASVEES